MVSAPTVSGVGKDAPTKTNAHGGKQSDSPYRSDLLPPFALLEVAKVLKHGADKYGENNWHAIPGEENLDHAVTHILAYLAGDGSDDHLEHAATRILFALDQKASGREVKLQAAKKAAPPYTPPGGFRLGQRVRLRVTGSLGTVCEPPESYPREDVKGYVYVLADGSSSPGGWLPPNVNPLANVLPLADEKKPDPAVKSAGNFTLGDRVLVGAGVDRYGSVVGFGVMGGKPYVDVRIDGDSFPLGFSPDDLTVVAAVAKPLIGGFNRGDRVRRKLCPEVVGVCDHVSPDGHYIRLQRDGQAWPDAYGYFPADLEKLN